MASDLNLMSTYLAREAITLRLAPSNADGTGDATVFSDYGPFTVRYYNLNTFTNQPTQYGFLLNIAGGQTSQESHSLWFEQANGSLFHKGTNGSNYAANSVFKKILDDSNYASVLDSVYVNVNGDTMTGALTFTNDAGIFYQGTHATLRMIRFIDNTSDSYGNGISIGNGGQTIIGGGESANAAVAQAGTAGAEIMYVCNDGDVLILSNMQNGWDSRKTWTFDTSGNLTIPASITRTGVSTFWYAGRNTALLKMTSITGYSPMLSLKTTNGTWDIGAHDYTGYTDKLLFTYITDANYTANDNTVTAQIKFGSDGVIEGDLNGNAATATRINGNLSAATTNVNRNIWVSSGAGADGIPNYISSFYMNPSTKVLGVPATTRIAASDGSLYLGNANNTSWVYLQDCASQASGSPWKLTQAGAFTCESVTSHGSLHLYGSTVGNTATDMVSGTAGLFSWGDTGPKITFDTSATPGNGQAGALIFTDHDTAATGASFHFVSNQSDWNVTSKRFHARSSISIGTNLPSTSYALSVTGTTYHSGAVTFANNTQNNMGDDAYIGDQNVAGHVVIGGLNGASGLRLAAYSTNLAASIIANRTDGLTIRTESGNSWIYVGRDDASAIKGIYFPGYGGGIYMNDTTYLRIYNNKRVYNGSTEKYAFYTEGGFASGGQVAQVFNIYYSGTWYDVLHNHQNGNLSLDGPGGSLYLSYYRGNTYFAGGTYYINRTGHFNGSCAKCSNIISVTTSLTFTSGRAVYSNTAITSTSRIFITGCNDGSTGVIFSTGVPWAGGVEIHGCDYYNGTKLSWNGTKANIKILIDNS